MQANLGHDLFTARAATGPQHWLGGILSAALTFAAVGTNIGHELTHRTTDRGAMLAGRWLLALTFDAEFAIEHVYGHHRRLATAADPATARRGEHFYAFVVRSIVGQTRSALQLERERLEKLGRPAWSLHNRYVRGWLMSAAIVAAFGAAAGAPGVVVFVLAGLAGRTVLEAVNYFEHYGLVRDPDAPVEPRHSWNSNKALSNVVLFNLARHSHHHAQGDARFWQLRSYRDAPTLPYGYLTCMLLVYVVPGWYRSRMTPLVLEWDRRYADATERRLADSRQSRERRARAATGRARQLMMFGRLFGRREPRAATVRVEPFGWEFQVEPGQTLLQAALAHGLPWPSRCRVGSCTTCRCRLLDGEVRALTDTSYVLSKEQLAARVILACQSQPRGRDPRASGTHEGYAAS